VSYHAGAYNLLHRPAYYSRQKVFADDTSNVKRTSQHLPDAYLILPMHAPIAIQTHLRTNQETIIHNSLSPNIYLPAIATRTVCSWTTCTITSFLRTTRQSGRRFAENLPHSVRGSRTGTPTRAQQSLQDILTERTNGEEAPGFGKSIRTRTAH